MWATLNITPSDVSRPYAYLDGFEVKVGFVKPSDTTINNAIFVEKSSIWNVNDPKNSEEGGELTYCYLADGTYISPMDRRWRTDKFGYCSLVPCNISHGWNEWDGSVMHPPCASELQVVLVRFRCGIEWVTTIDSVQWSYEWSNDNADYFPEYQDAVYFIGEDPCDIVAYQYCWTSKWYANPDQKITLFDDVEDKCLYQYFVKYGALMHASQCKPDSDARLWRIAIPYQYLTEHFMQNPSSIFYEGKRFFDRDVLSHEQIYFIMSEIMQLPFSIDDIAHSPKIFHDVVDGVACYYMNPEAAPVQVHKIDSNLEQFCGRIVYLREIDAYCKENNTTQEEVYRTLSSRITTLCIEQEDPYIITR